MNLPVLQTNQLRMFTSYLRILRSCLGIEIDFAGASQET